MNIVGHIRTLLWRLLGVDYGHILKVIDNVYLDEDKYTNIGKHTYNNNALVFRWCDAPIIIGKYCSIANGVRFIVDNGLHMIKRVTSYPLKSNYNNTKSDGIIIGNDVWIGQNVIILPNVRIGDGVTIAAGAVVNKDIPDYCIVGGVPAKVIYHKCSDEQKGIMKKIAWWDWDEEKINKLNIDFQLSISDFILKHS